MCRSINDRAQQAFSLGSMNGTLPGLYQGPAQRGSSGTSRPRMDSSFDSDGEPDLDRGSIGGSEAWDAWCQHFEEMDTDAEVKEEVARRLRMLVAQERYGEAAAARQQLLQLASKDTVAGVVRELQAALQSEQYAEAARLRDEGHAGLQGWWCGQAAEGDSTGHLLHITPEFGRWTGKRYTPRDLAQLKGWTDDVPPRGASSLSAGTAGTAGGAPPLSSLGLGHPVMEVFVRKDSDGRLSSQAVTLLHSGGDTEETVTVISAVVPGGAGGTVGDVEAALRAAGVMLPPSGELDAALAGSSTEGGQGDSVVFELDLDAAMGGEEVATDSKNGSSSGSDGGGQGSSGGALAGVQAAVRDAIAAAMAAASGAAPPKPSAAVVQSSFSGREQDEVAATLAALRLDVPPAAADGQAAAQQQQQLAGRRADADADAECSSSGAPGEAQDCSGSTEPVLDGPEPASTSSSDGSSSSSVPSAPLPAMSLPSLDSFSLFTDASASAPDSLSSTDSEVVELQRTPADITMTGRDKFVFQLREDHPGFRARQATANSADASTPAFSADGRGRTYEVQLPTSSSSSSSSAASSSTPASQEDTWRRIAEEFAKLQEQHRGQLQPSLPRPGLTDAISNVTKHLMEAGMMSSDTRMVKVTEIKLKTPAAAQSKITYTRIPTRQSRTDPFTGLYLGAFGPHGPELLQLSRGHWEDGEECVIGVKLTGDPNVPAGAVSFKARVGRQHRLATREVYPDELGVMARYKGEGRVAQPGFKNARWVDGELLQFSAAGSPLTGGAELGFVWAVPGEKRFLILLNRIDLE